MSAIISDLLKSATDPDIPFITNIEDLTTSQVRHDFLLESGLLVKAIKIINNDALSNLTFRTNSPSGALRTVDPNSELIVEGWTSYLEFNPNAVSGSGQVEIDLVDPKFAYKVKK